MGKKCFFTVISGKLHSEKGNAAVITLSVILVLTALGTVSLMASAMNVRMSGRTVAWSEDYYTLDTIAEKFVHRIEEEVLIPAEKDARTYVMNRLDRVKPEDLSRYFSAGDFAPSSEAQQFFNDYYTEVWTYKVGTDNHEYTVNDYELCIRNGSFMGRSIEEISRNYTDDGSPAEEKAARAYRTDLHQYTEELFNRVYFHLVARRLEYMHNNDPDFADGRENIVIAHISDPKEHYGNRIESAADRCTYRFVSIPGGDVRDTWNNVIDPQNGDITLYILARDAGVTGKEVRVALEVVLPGYEMIEKTIYTPVYGNPIWANALTVRGCIGIGKTSGSHAVDIIGDVYASGSNGITVYYDTTVNIYGNVYTAGNVQAKSSGTGGGGKLRVYTSATRPSDISASYMFKKAIYTDDDEAEEILADDRGLSDEDLGSIDRGSGEYLHQYHMLYMLDPSRTANQAEGTPNIPFVFKDFADQGNVYCDSLEVAEGVVGASLMVDGNLWTMDDIQMDGQQSVISVGTVDPGEGYAKAKYTYIGLRDESSLTDPNKSSSVINNFPFFANGDPNSRITLNSNLLVPGVAFYNFFDSDWNDMFYKSAESVTARTEKPVAIINSYMDPDGRVYYNQDGDEFRLMPEDIDSQRKAVIRFIDGIEAGVYTNIRSSLSAPEGYVAGVALIEKETGGTPGPATVYTHESDGDGPGTAVALVNSNNNWIEYKDLTNSNTLFRLHTAKTKMLGRYVGNYDPDAEPVSFDELVRKDLMGSLDMPDLYKVEGNGTLDVSLIGEAIVYCTGDLKITGSGEFRGAIICEGNVSIEGNVRIIYDENVIRRKLRNSAKLRDFFSKGEMGQKLFDVEEYSTTGGERIQVKLYRIAAWKETPKVN